MLGDSRRGSGGFCRARAALRGHGKKRSESGVGGRKTKSAARTAVDGGDGGRYTSDESPRRNREVVNSRAWPVRAKIAKIRRGEREPTKNSVLGAGHQLTQAITGGRSRTSANPAGPDEGDTAITHRGEDARSTPVVFRGRLWQTGHEIGIFVGVALALLEGVVERGEKLEPPLDLYIVVSHFAGAF